MNKRLLIDREPKMQKFKKEMIESYFVKETDIFSKFVGENDMHMSFVRKMIEKEFARNNEESQGFYQKYTIKSFEEVRLKVKSIVRSRQSYDFENTGDKVFAESNNLTHLKLSKPNMFEIIRSRALNMRNDEIHTLISADFDVLAIMRTIRGMMDSFWLMMQVYSDPKQYSTFCEFAYTWLGCYEVSKTACKVVETVISTICVILRLQRC